MGSHYAFVLGPGSLTARKSSSAPMRQAVTKASASSDSEQCCACGRRALLGAGFASLLGIVIGGDAAFAAGEEGAPEGRKSRAWKPAGISDDDVKCKNCVGSGKVSCDLCSGTGFWRALANNDRNQRYQGVVCPECEGEGTLRCSVCLGTGDGNVRGLLRRRRIEPGPGRILQTNNPEEEAKAANAVEEAKSS